MKKRIISFLCIACAIVGFAQEPDSLSLKDRIFYHYDRSEFAEVVQCCEEALAVYKDTDDLFEMAGCYNILGITYQRMGRFKEAIESYQLCAETMERLKTSEYALHQESAAAFYDKNIRYTRNNMAEIHFAMNELDQAEKLYRNCIEMLGEPHDTIDYQDLALYLQNLSGVGLKQAESLEGAEKEERLKSSVSMAEQALALSQQYGDLPFRHIYKMVALSQAYFAVGRRQEARALADEALSMAEAGKDAYLLSEIHAAYGGFEADEGHYKTAENHYRQAAILATENHFNDLRRTSLDGAYAAARHFDKALALDYFEQSVALKDSIFNEQQQQLIREYQMKYDLAEKGHQLDLQEKMNQQNKLIINFLVIIAVLLLVLLVVYFRLGIILKRRNKALARINEAKEHLFSVVSHDFKTSVVSQSMMLEAMNKYLDAMTQEQVKDKLLTLKTSADTLKNKMFNLFEWIKVELGSSENIKEPFNLRKMVDECIAVNAFELEQKELKISADIPEMTVYDNPNMVRLVLHNLLNNAIKFSWPRGEIKVGAKKEGNRIWISVEDHGTGISPDRKNTLLKSMVTPAQGTKSESGTGIGLMLCHALLEQNGGEITIESKESLGTTVQFSVKFS